MSTTPSKGNTEDDNVIRLKIEKWNQIGEEDVYSERKSFCGFPWSIRAYKNDVDNLHVILYTYKEAESNVWFCDVSVEGYLINQNEGGQNHKITALPQKHRFTPLNCNNGPFLALDKPSLLQDAALGFIKDDTIIVEVHITVHSPAGTRFRKKIDLDLFNPSSKSDGILIVERTKVYVSQQFLSTQSPFFDRIFFDRKFKEADQPETEIQDVVLSEFEVLMKMLYRTGEPFTGGNIEFILKLADRFEIMSIFDDAEKHLFRSKEPSIHTKLRLSDQYNLVTLQDQLLQKYTAKLIRELKSSPEYGMLKVETKDFLFQKFIELTPRESLC